MKERIRIPWSSDPSDSWEITQNLILGMCALALDAGENRSRHLWLDEKLIPPFLRRKCPGKQRNLVK